MIRTCCAASLFIALLLLQACAGVPNGPQPGFLGGNINFKPADDNSGAMVYRKPGLTRADIRKYDAFIIEPVTIYISPESPYKGIFPDELKAIADYFRDQAVKDLEPTYQVVTKPGPNVVRIRAAIVNMKRQNPVHPYEFTPVGFAFAAAKDATGVDAVTREKVLAGQSYIMSAAIEVGFYDSTTGELLGAYWDQKTVSDNKRALEGGATWGQVREALDDWAAKLRHRLDHAHGVDCRRRGRAPRGHEANGTRRSVL